MTDLNHIAAALAKAQVQFKPLIKSFGMEDRLRTLVE